MVNAGHNHPDLRGGYVKLLLKFMDEQGAEELVVRQSSGERVRECLPRLAMSYHREANEAGTRHLA
jgi:hypothetical protein